MEISDRLKEERKRLKLSQPEFGALGGAGKTTVISWERGDTTPNAAFLSAAAAAGADVRYIITGEKSGLMLTPDERALLELFRAAPLTVKAAAIGALQSGTNSQPKIHIGGKVQGQVVEGGMVNNGPMNFGSKNKTKK